MQQTFSTEAIVLDRQIFREYDSRITVYSRDHGILDLVARGAKRFKSKMSGHIEPLTYIKLMIAHGKQYDYLASAVNQDSYSHVKSNYDSLLQCGRALRFIKNNIKGGVSDDRIFYLLQEYLQHVNRANLSADQAKLYLIFFVLKFSDLLGYGLQLDNCVCRARSESSDFYLAYEHGCLLCDNCRKQSKHLIKLDPKILTVLKKMIKSDIHENLNEKLNQFEIENIEKICQYYIKYVMEDEF